MKKKNNLIFIAIVAVFTTIFTLFTGLALNMPRNIKNCTDVITQSTFEYDPETGTESEIVNVYDFDENICGIRITDVLDDMGRITKVNYAPDVFLKPDEILKDGEIMDLTKNTTKFAEKGTLQFVILGPNPESPTYNDDVKKIESHKRGDYWNFTIAIPPIFSACNIYQGYNLIQEIGDISDYNFIDFTNSDTTVTEKHNSKTQYSYVNMSYYASRRSMTNNILPTQNLITIHYESTVPNLRAITECPLIGDAEAVLHQNRRTAVMSMTTAIITIIVISIIISVSIIKKSSYFNQLLIVVGILIYSTSITAMKFSTHLPYLWTSLYYTSMSFSIWASLLLLMRRWKNRTVKPVIIVLTLIVSSLNFIFPCLSSTCSMVLQTLVIIFLCISSVTIIGANIYIAISREETYYNYAASLMISFSILSHVILHLTNSEITFPMLWLLVLIDLSILCICFKIFRDIEKQNVYLVSNLETEVNIHTHELTEIIKERNKMVRFLTHDIRRPLNYYNTVLNNIKNAPTQGESIELINGMLKKNKELSDNLRKISDYAKTDFFSEESLIIDLKEFLAEIYESTKPDCDASGVILENVQSYGDFKAYGKLQSLKSAVVNIVFNALEHAECSKVTLRVFRANGKVVISINDDGKGIMPDLNIFEPYISEYQSGTRGLGLYIAKQSVASMNGSLTYTSAPGSTTFFIYLNEYKE